MNCAEYLNELRVTWRIPPNLPLAVQARALVRILTKPQACHVAQGECTMHAKTDLGDLGKNGGNLEGPQKYSLKRTHFTLINVSKWQSDMNFECLCSLKLFNSIYISSVPNQKGINCHTLIKS